MRKGQRARTFTHEQAQLLVAKFEEYGDHPAVRCLHLMFLTGCRRDEARKLVWSEVDFAKGIIVKEDHKTRRHTGKSKDVLLSQEAIDLLSEWHQGAPEGVTQVFWSLRAGRYNPIGHDAVARWWNRIMDELGWTEQEYAPHNLRSNLVSQCLAQGLSVSRTAAVVGMEPATVERHYRAVNLDDRRRDRSSVRLV